MTSSRFSELEAGAEALRGALLALGLDPCLCGSVSIFDSESRAWSFRTMTSEFFWTGNISDEAAERLPAGNFGPSMDWEIHKALYAAFPRVSVIGHFHSPAAVAWCQAGRDLPCFGRTHASEFQGLIPCTRDGNGSETGKAGDQTAGLAAAIVETIRCRELDPVVHGAVLLREDGPWVWGGSPAEVIRRARVLEFAARSALDTLNLNPLAQPRKIVGN